MQEVKTGLGLAAIAAMMGGLVGNNHLIGGAESPSKIRNRPRISELKKKADRAKKRHQRKDARKKNRQAK